MLLLGERKCFVSRDDDCLNCEWQFELFRFISKKMRKLVFEFFRRCEKNEIVLN